MNAFRQSRQVWVAAHPRRLPCRSTAVHDELLAAYEIDMKRIESELAEAMEKELERYGQPA